MEYENFMLRNVSSFIYQETTQYSHHISSTLLKDLETKHITQTDSMLTERIQKEGIQVGYQWVIFGSHRNNPSINQEIQIIEKMETSPYFLRPIRIVIDKHNRLWSDNTHTTIAYIRRYGPSTKIEEIPYYIVDLNTCPYTIVSVYNTVNTDVNEIKQAISSAERIQTYIDNGFRPLHLKQWKIEDLRSQLQNLI